MKLYEEDGDPATPDERVRRMQKMAEAKGGFVGFRLVQGEGTREEPAVEAVAVIMRWDQDPANPGSRILFMTVDEDVFLLPGRYVEDELSAWEH